MRATNFIHLQRLTLFIDKSSMSQHIIHIIFSTPRQLVLSAVRGSWTNCLNGKRRKTRPRIINLSEESGVSAIARWMDCLRLPLPSRGLLFPSRHGPFKLRKLSRCSDFSEFSNLDSSVLLSQLRPHIKTDRQREFCRRKLKTQGYILAILRDLQKQY